MSNIPSPPQPTQTPSSMPPPGMTAPMVWYALVRVLPHIIGIIMGGLVACFLIWKVPGTEIHAIIAAGGPVLLSLFQLSKPAESETIQRLTGGGAGILLLAWLKHKLHIT